MKPKQGQTTDRPSLKSEEKITGWQLGRLSPIPTHVPSGWELVYLTSVAKLESGHTPSRRRPEYWEGDIPWISLHDSGALDVKEIFSTAQTIGQLGLANSSARLLPKGTVVFSRTATVGKVTVMGREMATSQDFANYICGVRLHNHFLAHLFRYMAPEWKRLMAGSTHNSIYMPVFRDLQILLPTRPEQEAIAEVLNNADALIETLERLIAKKRLLKQGVIQKLLTGRRRLRGFANATTGYKQTEVGVIPEDWVVTSMGELFTFQNGVNADKAAYGKGIPFINVLEVITYPTLTEAKIPGRISLPLQTSSAFRVQTGDVLFNRTSETQEEVGLASVYIDNKEVVFGGFVIRARPRDSSLDPMFSAYAMRSSAIRRQIVSRGQGAIRANIGQQELSKVQVFVPSLPEQEAIAAILSTMDAEIALLEAQLAKYRQLKQGLMQKLLTGRIRLI